MAVTIFLIVALVIAHRATSVQERQRLAAFARRASHAMQQAAGGHYQEIAPLHAMLRERTPLAPVTPGLVLLNVLMFVVVFFPALLHGKHDALVAWGGNYGPRTANGEWWRLITSLFLHSNVFHLFVNLVALVPAAFVLERLVGPLGFAAIYFMAGVFAGLFGLSVFPMAVSVGASGAVAGVYGLLIATCIWRVNHRTALTIPTIGLKYLAGTSGLFVAYTAAFGDPGSAIVGFLVGLLVGLAVAKGVTAGRVPAFRVATAAAITIAAAISTAVTLRGLTDARPEINAIVAFEERSASEFRKALEDFTVGRMTAVALADLIDRRILPDLAAARERLDALARVPEEQQPLVAAGEQYLQLREHSWRVRSEALRKRRMALLREADAHEATSLVAFQRIK